MGGGVGEVRWRGGGLYKWCGKVVYVKYIEVSGGWDSGWGVEEVRWWVI